MLLAPRFRRHFRTIPSSDGCILALPSMIGRSPCWFDHLRSAALQMSASNSDGDMAAAIWLPPGTEASTPQLIWAAVTGVEARKWPALARVLLAMLKSKPSIPHWYLALVGVPNRGPRCRPWHEAVAKQTR